MRQVAPTKGGTIEEQRILMSSKPQFRDFKIAYMGTFCCESNEILSNLLKKITSYAFHLAPGGIVRLCGLSLW